MFKELLLSRRCFQTAQFSVEDSGQVADETATAAAAAVYIPGEPDVRLCSSKMLLINADASELTFAPICLLSLAHPLRGGSGYF